MRSRFQVLSDDEQETVRPAPPSPAATVTADATESTARSALAFCVLALRVLSLRAVEIAGHLLSLFALATAFALWWYVLPNPTTQQLVGVGLYGAFMLLLLLVKRI